MAWVEFKTFDEFESWNNSMDEKYGYPVISVNQATGEIDKTAQVTETYSQAFEVEGKWIAQAEDADLEGLTLTDLRLPVSNHHA